MTKFAAVLLPLLLLACSAPRPQFTSATASDSISVLQDAHDIDAVSAAYHERVRLGLGSPFRVIEKAAYDARLKRGDREILLAQLFERVLDGNTYQIGATLPLAHLRVIEHALRSTYDPRIAELAVNLAYELAVTEKTVTPELQYAAAATVALLRDRALAQHDARHVREVARTHNQPAHALVPAMRAQRALLVEQPLMPVLNTQAQEAASRLALLMIGGVRQAARTHHTRAPQPAASELERDVAERILSLYQRSGRPPQSALIIAMRAAQLPYNALDEETFVAELALIDDRSALAAQRAAIALRPFAQEEVHAHSHRKTPDAKTFLAEFGITLRFGDDLPDAWRPHYAHTLYDALTDLRIAVPELALKGLTIEVRELEPGARHLAFHDPRSRTIRWAPSAGAGSLAHEIGHDLDWQAARRAYRRSGYASDLIGDVSGMLRAGAGETGEARATESFARQFDWLIATALGQQGRMNGHLSAVQHDWLPGHGGARPPRPNSKSANALTGHAAHAGRLGPEAVNRLEGAVRASHLPAAVLVVRELRQGNLPSPSGPRRARAEATSQPATQAYLAQLGAASGLAAGRALPENHTFPAAGSEQKTSYLLWYY